MESINRARSEIKTTKKNNYTSVFILDFSTTGIVQLNRTALKQFLNISAHTTIPDLIERRKDLTKKPASPEETSRDPEILISHSGNRSLKHIDLTELPVLERRQSLSNNKLTSASIDRNLLKTHSGNRSLKHIDLSETPKNLKFETPKNLTFPDL